MNSSNTVASTAQLNVSSNSYQPITEATLDAANQTLQGKSPSEIIEWALATSQSPLVTTNFRPYEVVLLHLISQLRPDISVLWVDSGYNTPATYRYADALIDLLSLNVITYLPKVTRAHRDARFGDAIKDGIPNVDDPAHIQFTEEVKLEPFRRALSELRPDVWFNAIRQDQTEFRQALDVLSLSKEGILKVAPLFYWTEADLDAYITAHHLPNELDYFDPTKVEEKRECGLHTQL